MKMIQSSLIPFSSKLQYHTQELYFSHIIKLTPLDMAKVVSNDFQYFYPVVVYIGTMHPPCHLHGLHCIAKIFFVQPKGNLYKLIKKFLLIASIFLFPVGIPQENSCSSYVVSSLWVTRWAVILCLCGFNCGYLQIKNPLLIRGLVFRYGLEVIR